jgi:hypothetical protein
MSKQNEQKERKKYIHAVRPAGLKTRSCFSYTIITKKILFLTVLLLFAQFKMYYW